MEDPFISRGKGSEIRGSHMSASTAKDFNAHLHKNLLQTPESSDESEDSYDDADDRVKYDMSQLEHLFHSKGLKFRMIKRIGEGTFSTVYKAEDLQYDFFQNDWDKQLEGASKWSSSPAKSLKRMGESLDADVDGQPCSRRHHFVAIKKIYVTSSPLRIQNELELLYDLRGCDSICPLITAFRYQDQVIAVLPYYRHQDFRLFYRRMTPHHIRQYFRSLFTGLQVVHKHGIVHRDIKPTNFLYDVERRKGVLVDFGLAEREGTESGYCRCLENNHSRRAKLESSKSLAQATSAGYPKNDQRPSRRANRAGTRGFRAPEVLFKCAAQTAKIDIWSVGVILLTILCQRFPFFNSADDVEAMIEMASIFGQRRMKSVALLHGTVFECTLPTVGQSGYCLKQIVQWSAGRHESEGDLDPETMECIAFLELCLELDPRKRISARKALASDFLAEKVPPESEGGEMED